MKLRRFNESGIERFDMFRETLSGDNGELSEIVCDPANSDLVSCDIDIQPQEFSNRFKMGEYLNQVLQGATVLDLARDRGIWTWLAAFFFDQLCPSGTNPGDRARWVPAVGDFRKYYRHLLAGPYQIYRAHRDNPWRVLALLAGPPSRPGEIAEQLASRQELITNRTVMEVATTMYIDPGTSLPKRGAAGKVNGSARRYAEVLNQLDLTWDLYTLESFQLLKLLPEEFNRFKP